MTIWILALFIVACAVGLGYKMGAIRGAVSFLGIIFATLLASTLGKLFAWLMPHLGIHNETLVWLLAPIEAFVLILIIFKSAGFWIHHKVEMYYKYKAGDLRMSLWERMNHRVGACIGTLNGLAYVVVLAFVIFNFSYWTVQIAPGDNETRTTRVINQLGRDLEGTGLSKAAKAVAPLPDNYYKMADLAGLVCQNPDVAPRLGNYPPFLSLLERDDLKQLAESPDLASAWKSHAPMGQILNQDVVQKIVENNDLLNLVYGIVLTNIDDLTTFLKTGQSPKYDPEPILGRWDFNVGISVAMLRQMRPNIQPREFALTRALWGVNYAHTTFVAGSDNQAFMKEWPTFKNPTAQQPQTEELKGTWSAGSESYTVQLSGSGGNKSYVATTDGARLTLKEGKNVYIFDRE